METQSVRNISWVTIVNLGLGIMTFLLGFPGLIFLVVFLAGALFHVLLFADNRHELLLQIGHLVEGYFNFTNTRPYIVIMGFLLGLITIFIGLVTLVLAKDKVKEKIGIAGITLGILGAMGNFIAMYVLMIAGLN